MINIINLTDDTLTSIMTVLDNGTNDGKSITSSAVCEALGVSQVAGKAALALMGEQGFLDGYSVARGKGGGFMRTEDHASRRVSNSAKTSVSATKKVDKLRKQLALLAASGIDVSALVAEARDVADVADCA